MAINVSTQGSKRKLDVVECDWEESSNAETIQTAKNSLFRQSGRADDTYRNSDSELVAEIRRLKDNQEKLIVTNATLSDNLRSVMSAMEEVKAMLRVNLQKGSESPRVATSSTETQTEQIYVPISACSTSAASAAVSPVVDTASSSSEIPTLTAHAPTIDEGARPPADVDSDMGFSLLKATCMWESGTVTDCVDVFESEEVLERGGDSNNCVPETVDIDFAHVPYPLGVVSTPPCRSVYSDLSNCVIRRPSRIDIGTTGNQLFVDGRKYERAARLPTTQRVILALMDLVFSPDEMAESNVCGGVKKYKGIEKVKKPLCGVKLDSIFRHTASLFNLNADDLASDQVIRNAINSKCRGKKNVKT